VTSQPHAFLTIDHGSATVSVALIGRAGGAWRLIGSLAIPAGADLDPAIDLLVERTVAADPVVAEGLGVIGLPRADFPILEVRSLRPKRLAVVTGSERTLAGLVATAARSGWRTSGASTETVDPLAMTRLLLDRGVEAIVVGAGDPPRADERGAIRELATLVAAVAVRRPEIPIVLSGSMSEALDVFGDVGARPGEVVLGPAAQRRTAGIDADAPDPLADLLLELALPADDPRRALASGTKTLADVLDRRIEAIMLGHDAAARAVAVPGSGGEPSTVRLGVVPAAAVAPEEPDDEVVDGIIAWSTMPADRHRIRDRMRELRIAPWSDPAGDGAALRMAAARAALTRLAHATASFDAGPVPDLVVAASGVWTSVPAPAVALAHIDVLRRPGASQYALDHARLIGPLGAIPDAGERRVLLMDLVDDLLAPLGSVVTPAGLRAGRSIGTVAVHARDGISELDLMPGGLELVDLPPGATAVAEFKFRERVRLGGRGRHFAIDVAGGLGGLMVDLRDVPLRLPDRADRRRDLLAAWQSSLWAGSEG
jgi:hypothetical protein